MEQIIKLTNREKAEITYELLKKRRDKKEKEKQRQINGYSCERSLINSKVKYKKNRYKIQ